jgi:hypothetical protein
MGVVTADADRFGIYLIEFLRDKTDVRLASRDITEVTRSYFHQVRQAVVGVDNVVLEPRVRRGRVADGMPSGGNRTPWSYRYLCIV